MEREITHVEPKNDLSGQVVNGEIADIVGAKVKRGGPDWMWEDQGADSEYGIVNHDCGDGWYNVHWFDKNGNLLDIIHNYRAGYNFAWQKANYDLLYY